MKKTIIIDFKQKSLGKMKEALNEDFRNGGHLNHESTDYYLFSKQERKPYVNGRGRSIASINKYLNDAPTPNSTHYFTLSGQQILLTLPMFGQPSTNLSSSNLRNLELLSVEASMFAYDDYLRVNRVQRNGNGTPYHLKRMLENLNFYDIRAENYNDNNPDNVSFVLARRTVWANGSPHELIAVIIRGTDSDEWQGNFKLWENKNTPSNVHYSFNEAMKEVKRVLESYASLSSSTKLWITGQPRSSGCESPCGYTHRRRHSCEGKYLCLHFCYAKR